MPCRMFISIGTASETWAPASFDRLPRHVGHPGHVDEQVVGPSPMSPLTPPLPWASRSMIRRIPTTCSFHMTGMSDMVLARRSRTPAPMFRSPSRSNEHAARHAPILKDAEPGHFSRP